MIGADEEFAQQSLGEGKGSRMTAHLSPRSKLELSWNNADSGAKQPLLTAQGEIAIDIDEEQMRTRSSWAIQCIRGASRTLEVKIDDGDVVTELQLDDQAVEDGIERVLGTGKLTIQMGDSLRRRRETTGDEDPPIVLEPGRSPDSRSRGLGSGMLGSNPGISASLRP